MTPKITKLIKKLPSIFFEYAGVISIAFLCLICYFFPAEDFSISAGFMLGREYWRIPMALFMHNGIIHLATNMFALLLIGTYLERRLGSALFLFIYLSGGLLVNAMGGFFLVFCRPEDTIAGASTGIYSALGALLAMTLINRREIISDFSLINLCAAVFYLIAADIAPASITAFVGHTLALIFGMLAGFVYSGKTAKVYSGLILTLITANAKIYQAGSVHVHISLKKAIIRPVKNYDQRKKVI